MLLLFASVSTRSSIGMTDCSTVLWVQELLRQGPQTALKTDPTFWNNLHMMIRVRVNKLVDHHGFIWSGTIQAITRQPRAVGKSFVGGISCLSMKRSSMRTARWRVMDLRCNCCPSVAIQSERHWRRHSCGDRARKGRRRLSCGKTGHPRSTGIQPACPSINFCSRWGQWKQEHKTNCEKNYKQRWQRAGGAKK